MESVDANPVTTAPPPQHPFRAAVFRGIGVIFPPLATIIIFLWSWGVIQQYVLRPVTAGIRDSAVYLIADIRPLPPAEEPGKREFTAEGRIYQRVDERNFIPREVYETVLASPGMDGRPETPWGIYRRYVEIRYLRPYLVVPLLLVLFILVMYLLGKFITAGMGAFFWNVFEQGVNRLPLIRSVYSSVKQVGDFLFVPREVEYSRAVAIEYPRHGVWSLGFVTGESLLDISAAANEPVYSVLIPTSPAPMTGFTVSVRKSDMVDLNITVDQALQYLISCGVVVPPQQVRSLSKYPLGWASAHSASRTPRAILPESPQEAPSPQEALPDSPETPADKG